MEKLKPRRVIFTVSDDDHEALERVRAVRGYRSCAEALRAFIQFMDENPEDGPEMESKPPSTPLSVRLPDDYGPVVRVSVPVADQIKPAYGSRLKKR